MTNRCNVVSGDWHRHDVGPDPMVEADLKTFFNFYKKHPSRRLAGFFRDIESRDSNVALLAQHLRGKKSVNCLIVGCAHWANPRDLGRFITKIQRGTRATIAALDVLPYALVEAVEHGVDFIPVITPAQATPFVPASFDILVADGLLNCCSFDQHEAIVYEMARIAKPSAVVLLGLAHAPQERVVHAPERAMPAYCRPLGEFEQLFRGAGFEFHPESSIETAFGADSDVRIENCIAIKRNVKTVSRPARGGAA